MLNFIWQWKHILIGHVKTRQISARNFRNKNDWETNKRKEMNTVAQRLMDKKDDASLMREDEDRSTWHATNRRDMSKTWGLIYKTSKSNLGKTQT